MRKTLKYKILICGVGSIGERHIKNLLSLGYQNIILYRKKKLPLRNIKNDFPIFTSLKKALAQKPDVAFICNPTHLHIQTAIECAQNGCDLFIEKPLGHKFEDCIELKKILKKNKQKAMVGYMSRFHPCLIKGREWIENDKIGKVIFARTQWGEYLPDWHPWEDYRLSYAARKNMGGGPSLTLSHEIDTMLWYFGKVNIVKGLPNYNSELDISTEHSIDLLLSFKSGVTANIHLDYVQQMPTRIMEIIGTKGKILFDYYKNQISLKQNSSKKIRSKKLDSFKRNDLFISEVKYFFKCIKENKNPVPSIDIGSEVVKIALLSLK